MRLVLVPGLGAFEVLLEGFADSDDDVGIVDEHETSIHTGDDRVGPQRVIPGCKGVDH